ncbi:MAG: hypothetical protein KF854_16860 [Nitrospira sp.]|nr:hypothetical protein [Nitrospira sp.]MBX3371752.1 hypothetical protein [Nitrospira sp.]HMX91910.1 hypothetical protein [Nitrospira sp.]HNI18535.1 hypothetical protein [Nitrospira sp.]HNM60410.1 hypothetical protein [Nitrospira sp.]
MKQLAAHPAAMDATFTLLDLLQQRKTRRFGRGMTLPGGPLQYTSHHDPVPLSREEERYLIYAAIGRSGRNLGDMQFVGRPGVSVGQGNALMNFNSRTVPSPCSAQTTQLFYTNDDGVFFVADAAGPDHPWDLNVIQLQSSRLDIPREAPFMLPFNQWYTNRPGTTLFMPVTNIASLYLNLLLMMFSEETGYFIVDTDNGNAACGLEAFRKSAGGHLHDDIKARRMFSLRELDAAICETAIQEQGIICEHLSLMQQALGLGGGIQSVGSGRHLLGMEPHIYPGLGFHFVVPPGKPLRANPVGIPGVWEGPTPPFVPSMKDAVTNLVESKFGADGTFRKPQEQPYVQRNTAQQVPQHSERAIEATIAFTEYVLATYGRFPAHADACKSIVACQTHHLDEDFYATFYPDSALPDAHREHMHTWHSH